MVHRIAFGNVDILVNFKHTQAIHDESPSKDEADSIEAILEPLFDGGEPIEQFAWKSYLAPQRLKSDLMSIGEELDPEHLERFEKSRQACMGDENIISAGVPLVLFHGPPGSGKTFAMKIISAQSNLKPFVLQTSSERIPIAHPRFGQGCWVKFPK